MPRIITPEQLAVIAKRHRPKGWTVRYSKHRYHWCSAEANGDTRTIYAPVLKDVESLFLYLHEVGHVKQDHFNLKLPRHREEYEAERYALHILRVEGIPVKHEYIDTARARLRGSIDYDLRRKVKIQRHIARWAKHGGYNVQRSKNRR